MPAIHQPAALAGLVLHAPMAELIASLDWRRTSLGPMEEWPAHLMTPVGLMLHAKFPIAILWGPQGVLLYNDAYAKVAGSRHPAILGLPVREAWPEAVDFNGDMLRRVLAGEALSYEDMAFELEHHGVATAFWMTLHYSALPGADGRPAGVLALVQDTTDTVRAKDRLGTERERFARLFDQSPSFMAMLEGPEHRIELANPNFLKLVGHRCVLGRTVADALHDARDQGYVDLLDQVYTTGMPFAANGSRYAVQTTSGGPVSERYVDFVFQPIRDAAGDVSGLGGRAAQGGAGRLHGRTQRPGLGDRHQPCGSDPPGREPVRQPRGIRHHRCRHRGFHRGA
jgi:PAS domain S-box-containing protein